MWPRLLKDSVLYFLGVDISVALVCILGRRGITPSQIQEQRFSHKVAKRKIPGLQDDLYL